MSVRMSTSTAALSPFASLSHALCACPAQATWRGRSLLASLSRQPSARRSSMPSETATNLATDPAASLCTVGRAGAFFEPLCAEHKSAHLRWPRRRSRVACRPSWLSVSRASLSRLLSTAVSIAVARDIANHDGARGWLAEACPALFADASARCFGRTT
jgi:hypothetical protein